MPTKRDTFFRLQAVLREGISGVKTHERVGKSFSYISQRVLCLSLFKIYLLDEPPKRWNALTMYIGVRVEAIRKEYQSCSFKKGW